MCDKKHANKHQVKEDQTHMPLPPEGTSHAILLVDIPLGKEQCMRQSTKAWFPYDCWRSLMIAWITSKVFSDRNNHMETKFSFCQRSPMIPATAND